MKNNILKNILKRTVAFILAAVVITGGLASVSAATPDGSAESPYTISTATAFQNIKNDLDAHYILTNNINLSGIDSFAPIGNEVDGPFTGTIDGAGYTVSYLTIAEEDQKYVGVVGYNEGTVKNLNVTYADICGGRYTGGIVGYNATGATVTDCSVSGEVNGYAVAMDAYTGGIAGFNNGVVTSCNNSADVFATDDKNDNFSPFTYIGGIIGYSDAEILVTDCTNKGKITYDTQYSGTNRLGGIVGMANNAEFINCHNYGLIDSVNFSGYTGGIIGYATEAIFTDCSNSGLLEKDNHIGGMLGYAQTTVMTRCVNNADIRLGEYIGGMAAEVSKSAEFNECINYGDIVTINNSSAEWAGGICGYGNKQVFNSCINYDKISGDYAGGISGNGYCEAYSCINYGDVHGSGYAGGIVGRGYGGIFKNCVDTGYVSGYNGNGGIIGRVESDNNVIENCAVSGYYYNSTYYSPSPMATISYSYSSTNRILNSIAITDVKGDFVSGFDVVTNNICINLSDSFSESGTHKNNYYWNQGELCTTAEAKTIEELKAITSDLNTTEEEIWVSDPMYNSGLPMIKNSPARLLLNEAVLVLKAGETAQLKAYFDYKATSDVRYESYNTASAVVSSTGLITAKENGSACISVRTLAGEKANCWVYVINESASLTLPETLTVTRNEYYSMTATLSNNANERIYWQSSDTDIATIEQSGSLYARKAGTVEITATGSVSGLSDTCLVTVIDPQISNLSFSYSSHTVNIGTPYKMATQLSISPNPYRGTISWRTSNEKIATVDQNGVVTGIMPGSAVITATSDTGYNASTTVTVKQPALTIELNHLSATLDIGLTIQLRAIITPDNSTDSISWKADNSGVASVDSNGLVTAKAAGTTKITAKTTSGREAYCFITVNPQQIAVENITLNTAETRLSVSAKQQLTATVTPSNATNKAIIWATSDKSIVTVSESGVIEGISEGIATVTATTSNGIVAECRVTVIDYGALTSAFTVGSVSAKRGETVTVAVAVKDNPGVMAFSHLLSFDTNSITLNSVTPAKALGGELISNISNESGSAKIIWLDSKDSVYNGDIYYLEFTVKDTATIGNSVLSISFSDSDVCNSNSENVIFLKQNGNINIYEYAVGDINLDSLVGIKDILLLSKYLLGVAELTDIQLENADVNSDGVIDIKDRVRLSKQLIETNCSSITSDNSTAAPTVTVESVEGTIGNKVLVGLTLSEEVSLSGLLLSLEYNTDVLTLESVEMPNANGNILFKNNNGYSTVLWHSNYNQALAGEFITLKFQINSSAIINSYPIKLYLGSQTATDFNLGSVTLNTADGAVLALESTVIEGDISGDGFVNSEDITLIRKAVMGAIAADNLNLDVNSDGYTDIRDLVALKKLLVG